MFQRLLVIFENEKVCPQALDFAMGLALRMDSEVTLLMLMEMAFLEKSLLGAKRATLMEMEKRMAKKLSQWGNEFLKKGITLSTAIRVGSPPEEFLKFLAERPPFQSIVWGSGEDLQESGQAAKIHWLSRVAGNLECPVVTVGRKKQ
ncbi:MAG: universal stress protein [Desulfobacteraceae bacterium]|nr:MAG: universal stress protein [Desulfobacteraceae bacterium]